MNIKYLNICPGAHCPLQSFSLQAIWREYSRRTVSFIESDSYEQRTKVWIGKKIIYRHNFATVDIMKILFKVVLYLCKDNKINLQLIFLQFCTLAWLADILEGENSISGRKLKEQLARWLPLKYISNIRSTSNK